MRDRAARLIQAKLEATFERYSGEVLAGGQATPERFIEALEAEGLSLSIADTEAVGAGTGDRRMGGAGTGDRRTESVGVGIAGMATFDRRTGVDRRAGGELGRARPEGRRSLGLLARRVRGLS